MRFFRVSENQIINLEQVTRIQFDENDKELSGDDRCSVYFTDGSELDFYGDEAKKMYGNLIHACGL